VLLLTSTTTTAKRKRKPSKEQQPWEKEYKKAKKYTEFTDPNFAGWNPLPLHQRKEDWLDKAFRGEECAVFVKECKKQNRQDKRNATKRKKRQEQTKVCCKLCTFYLLYIIYCTIYFTHQLYVLYLRKSLVCLLVEKRLLMLLLLPLLWQLLDDVVPQILLLKCITYKVEM